MITILNCLNQFKTLLMSYLETKLLEKNNHPFFAYTLPKYHGCLNIYDYFDLLNYIMIVNLNSFDIKKRKKYNILL